jgi:uncharacterized protein (DUF342 family)
MTTKNEAERPKHIAFGLEVDEKSGTTFGVLVSANAHSKLKRADVDEALSDAGILDWAIDDPVINTLIDNFGQKVVCRLAIALRRDATFEVILNPDKMAAYIDVVPAQGGADLTVEILRAGLIENLVADDQIDLASLKEVISAPEAQRISVAIGKAAIPGADSQFNSLVEEQSASPDDAAEDSDGKIDYLAGKLYITVEPQTAIMERIPPQLGKDGYNIFGQRLTALPGAAIPWAKKMPGTLFDEKNPEILLAETAGHPVIFEDGSRVDDSLIFDKIDITTGHINFDGSILIKGDVHADMKIEATGNIFIMGVVERAQVKAGNNLIVDGGILGDPNMEVPEEGLPKYDCILEAGGSIEAQYINLAYLSAGKNITVKEYIFNSTLKAGKRVAVGNKGGKGRLIGGETYAVESVTAKTLGSQAYSVTKITLGFSKMVIEFLQKLDVIREQRVNQAKKLRDLLPPEEPEGSEKIARSKDELHKIRKIERSLLTLKDSLKEIDRRRKQATPQEHDHPIPFISAKSTSYPNCQLEIHGASIRTKTEQQAIIYVKKDGRIVRRK